MFCWRREECKEYRVDAARMAWYVPRLRNGLGTSGLCPENGLDEHAQD